MVTKVRLEEQSITNTLTFAFWTTHSVLKYYLNNLTIKGANRIQNTRDHGVPGSSVRVETVNKDVILSC